MTTSIKLELIDQIRVSINGVQQDNLGSNAAAILIILCTSKDRKFGRTDIANMIWGHDDINRSRNSFRNSLKGLRDSLGPDGKDLIQTNAQRELMLVCDECHIDSDQIVEQVVAGRVPQALLDTMSVSDKFLNKLSSSSTSLDTQISFLRTRFRQTLIDGLHGVFDTNDVRSRRRGDAAKAMLNVDPTSELAARCLMQWHWECGEPLSAVNVYHELCRALDAQYGDAEPSQETDELLVAIKRGDVPDAPAPRKTTPATIPVSGFAETPDIDPLRWSPAPARPVVLVRRFTASGDDPRTARFAVGFSKGLIGRLSRFRNLDIIGHASSLLINAEVNDADAARSVAARYVVNGDLLTDGDRVVVELELTDARRNQIIHWERLEQPIQNIFDIENEVESIAASRMAINIDLAERNAARSRDPVDLDAYSLVVSGWLEDLENGATGRGATERAMTFFNAALGHDRHYAAAHAGVARAHSVQWRFGWSEDRDTSMELATEHALRAVDADPNDAMAHAELGYVSLYRREHDRSIAAYERAMELNPSNAEIMAFYADALRHNGTPERSVPLFERALKLNPLRPDIYLGNLAGCHFVMKQYSEAIATVRKMRQPLTAQRCLTAALMLDGQEEEGLREAAILRDRIPEFDLEKWLVAVPDRKPEYSELLREGLKKAGF